MPDMVIQTGVCTGGLGMENRIKEIALQAGAAGVGISSVDRLDASVPSMDPEYALPGARSIISVMMPLDGDVIRRYLGKEDHQPLQRHETEVYRDLFAVSARIADFLTSHGNRAVAVEPNLDYRFKDGRKYRRIPFVWRQKTAEWLSSSSGPLTTFFKRLLVQLLYEKTSDYTDWNLTPRFSHRYGAVAAGLAGFGWSGNVMSPQFGSRVLFDTVITDAGLASDPMLEESPCDGCRICTRVCQVGMIHETRESHVTIGGKRHTHAKRGHNLRCIFCCAGFTGQDLHRQWSTWSPGRISLPDNDDNIVEFWNTFAKENLWKHNYYSRCLSDLVFHSDYGFIRKPRDRFRTTCGNCQLVCWETREQRRENYRILTSGGVVVEGPDFSFRVVKGEGL